MTSSDAGDKFEPEAVERIIRRAMHIESESHVSRDDLIDAAREAGIAPEAIERAIEEESDRIHTDREQRADQQRQQARFRHQLSGAAIVVVFLFLVDLMTHGGWWFQWPLLGIGLGMAMKARKVAFTNAHNQP